MLYFVEGFPFGIFRDVWGVYFRVHGASLESVGAISALYLAWSLKFLWSPLVDAWADAQRWICGSLACMAAALLVLSERNPSTIDGVIWLALAAFCVASATQDVAIDGYTIRFLPRGEEGPANGIRITAYRAALIAGGGALVLLPRAIGWPATWSVAAAVLIGLALVAWQTPRVAPHTKAKGLNPLTALRPWLARPGAVSVLAFVMLYRLGDLGMGPMVKPFWVDRGLSLEEIGLVSTTLGAVATVLGALAGGAFVARRGIAEGLLVLGLFALFSNLGYAAAAAFPETGRTGVYAASVVESFSAGLASAAFLAFLMRICEREHAAVQFACLTALYALPGTFAGAASGWAAQSMGYAGYFAATAVLALPAFAFLPRTRAWLTEPAAEAAKEAHA